MKLRSYNGMLTGPTLRAKAGDTLQIHLRNDLPAEHEMEMTAECATPSHGFNTTNLHTHGLHKEWRDTILVPLKGEIKIRTRFERFSGKFVLHCHILTHEDEGMMQLVEVKEK